VEIRRIILIDQETHREAGRDVSPPTRKVAACAVIANPLASRPAQDDLEEMVDLSVEVGALLTERAVRALGELKPSAYGKAALVGMAGDLEHGAAMIHVRMGLAMRRGIGGGAALIPGNAKVGGPGDLIDLLFGDLEDPWEYNTMDGMEIVVPGAPRPDEILLVVGLAAGGRANARVRGATAAQAAEVARALRR